jgi:hypothetical protein
MIRFLIRRKILSRGTGLLSESIESIDADVPDLERALLDGGHDEHGAYDYRELIGTEVLPGDERRYTERELANGCIEAGIPDSEFESLLVALKA